MVETLRADRKGGLGVLTRQEEYVADRGNAAYADADFVSIIEKIRGLK